MICCFFLRLYYFCCLRSVFAIFVFVAFGVCSIWFASAVLLLFGLVPGMPNTLFLAGALFSGAIAWFTSKSTDETKNESKEEEKDENHGKIDIDEVSDNSSISLDLGYGLISMVDSNDKKSAASVTE